MKLLTATLASFEDNKAILQFEDGQKLLVDKINLPGFSQGDTISLSFYNDIDSKEQRQKILKAILNEIIEHNPDQTDEKD